MINLSRRSLSPSWICTILVCLVFVIEANSSFRHTVEGDRASHKVGRVRRAFWNMCNLMHHYTDRWCFHYLDYGCFCGLGQQGSTPVDGADRCCQQHDDCFGDAHEGDECSEWGGLGDHFEYNCDDNGCKCTAEDYCGRKRCDCDLTLAICLGNADYNPQHKYYDTSQCN